MNNSARINGFDALRTIAMWLGIVLHSIIVYKVVPEPNWPHDPGTKSYLLDWLYSYIHTFRMPLFFMVAGFFAHLVIARSGVDYFVKQRFKRIVIPFIVGVCIIVPLSLLPFSIYKFYYLQNMNTAETWKNSLRQLFKWNGLAHLWFLYYLIIFYVFSLGFIFIFKKQLNKLKETLSIYITNISFAKLLIACLFLLFIFFINKTSIPGVYTGIKPSLTYFLYYGFFFALGWILQINVKSVESLKKNSWLLFFIGTSLSAILFFKGSTFTGPVHYLTMSLQIISLIAGFTGLFIRYFNTENKVWRYCSDATYWVYLVHLSLVVSFQVILLNSPIYFWFRLPIVLIAAFSISLLSYHFFVRFTVIGEFLHGKRSRQHSKDTRQVNIPPGQNKKGESI
ncbi:MAG: acyltransferase family protein [Chitinophagaceae bacterium]